MATTDTEAQRGDVIPVGSGPTIVRPDIVAAYASMLAEVPDAGGDGFESILEAIALASDAADLDAPWRSTGLESLVNTPIRIERIRKMPSDYPDGLPWFLVVDAAVVSTGELVTFTTGAVSVVAQLAKAHALGALPMVVTPRQSDRPSKSGYFPQHLQIGG